MDARAIVTFGGRIAAAALLVVWANEVPSAAPAPSGESVVFGEKVSRCTADDGSRVAASGVRLLTAENGPLTVTVSGGRIASVLTPAVKLAPGAASAPQPASLRIGAPTISRGSLAVNVTVRNRLTDCAARLHLTRGHASRGNAPAHVSSVRFGEHDGALVPAGHHVVGLLSLPLDGDGSYEITASTYTEIGPVR